MGFYVKSGLTQMRFKKETTRGTYDAPQASDNDIRLQYDGMISNETTKEMIGKLADATFKDGRHYTRERAIGLPELTVEFVKAATPQDSPNWFKIAEACGVNEHTTPTTLEKGIEWTGQPACAGLSALVEGFSCGSTPEGQTHQIRGIAGNMEIKAESAQSPLVIAFSDLKGAWIGPVDRASAAVDPLTGNDTAIAEMFGGYTTTIGAFEVDVYAYSFNTNNDINFVPANNDEGIAYFDVMNQGARMTMTIPVVQVASKDIVTEYFTNQIETLITILGGVSSGYNMTHNACEYVGLSYTDVQGVQCYELVFNVLESALWVQK